MKFFVVVSFYAHNFLAKKAAKRLIMEDKNAKRQCRSGNGPQCDCSPPEMCHRQKSCIAYFMSVLCILIVRQMKETKNTGRG